MGERWFSTRRGVAGAAVIALAGCGGGDRQITVFAASSLTEVFAEIEAIFEADHPGIDVVVNAGGSSSLAAQIEGGAPADVFAAADTDTMLRLTDGGSVESRPIVFARNRLAIAVEPGNPTGIVGLDDLADEDLTVVLAAPEVPAGAYAALVLERADVTVEVASYEQSVRSVAAKVALGEADAGIVYRTDILASAGELAEVVIADEQNISAVYPIVTIDEADGDSDAFVDVVLGPDGQAVLLAAGFELP
jgi:molybdate transport system substrate-binding protein